MFHNNENKSDKNDVQNESEITSPLTLLAIGNFLFEKGRYLDAIECYNELMRITQEDHWIYYRSRGIAYDRQGKFELAIHDLSEAIRLNPNHADTRNYRGLCYYHQKEYGLAVDDLSEAIRLDPDNILYYANRANIYYKQKRYDHTIKDANEVLRRDPKHAEAYRIRGVGFYYKGNYKLAIIDLSQAIHFNPNDDTAYYNRGATYQKLNLNDLAIFNFNETIRLNPNHEEAYMDRAILYFTQKKYEFAILDFKQAIRINPNNKVAYINLSAIHCVQKKYELALQDCNEAIHIDSNCSVARENRGEIYYLLSQVDLYNQEMKVNIITHEIENFKGQYHLIIENISPQEISQSLPVNIKESETKSNSREESLGDIYYEKGEYELAIHYYTKEIENDYKNSAAYSKRSASYFAASQYELAFQDTNELLKINPNDADAYNKRGDIYCAQYQYQLAIPCYKEAILIEPTNTYGYLRRAQAYLSHAKYENKGKFCYDENTYFETISNIDNRFAKNRDKNQIDDNTLIKYELAIQDCNKAIAIDPQDTNAYNVRADIYSKSIQPFSTFYTFKNGQSGVKSSWYNSKDYLSTINILKMTNPNAIICTTVKWCGDYDNAIKDYNKIIRLKPNDSFAYADRGVTYYKLGQYRLSIEDLTKAVEIDPSNSGAYNDRGFIYGENYQLKLAIQDLNKAIEINPYYATAYNNRGYYLAKRNQFNLAIKDLPYMDVKRREKIIDDAIKVDLRLDLDKNQILQNAKILNELINKYQINVELIEALYLANDSVRIWITQTWPQIVTQKDIHGNLVILNDWCNILPPNIWNQITKYMVGIENTKNLNDVAHKIRNNGFGFFALNNHDKKIWKAEKTELRPEERRNFTCNLQ
jgi:tetratricopeptide (TPR) repeat protein